MYAHLTRGQRARLTRGRAQQQEHLARERGAARSCVWRTHKTAAPPRANGDSARNTSTAPYKTRAVREPRAPPHPTRKRSKRSNGAPRNGKICAPCMIRGARAARRAPSWQDIRAMYPPTAVCGAFRMHGAHILPKPAHFGCMACESCRELAIFPSEAPFGMHGAQNLPRIAARERTAAESCHCQSGQGRIRAQSRRRRTLGNAFREHFAIVERLGTHRGIILPWQAARKCTAATPCHGSLLQECFSTTYCQEGPRLPELAAKSQWCHGVERRHQNEASANSTPRADTSKKP